MSDTRIYNAVIKGARITTEDHDLLSVWLTLDYGDCEQGFGGFNLYSPAPNMQKANYTGMFIWRCMKVVGVMEWSKMVGQPIRVKRDDQDRIIAIGHFIKDYWFYPRDSIKAISPR